MRSLHIHPNYYKKIFTFFSPGIRMSGKNIYFEGKKNQKSDFYRNQKVLKVYDIHVNEILGSKKEPYGTSKSIKQFIGYNDDDIITKLCIKLHQMIGHVKCFDSNKTMSFKVTDKTALKKLY